jgi:Fe2+ or Zn2+ uptake regulation protein
VVCVKCRRIRDIEIPHLDRLLAGRSELGEFTVIGSSLEIHALCDDCARQAKASRTKKPRG